MFKRVATAFTIGVAAFTTSLFYQNCGQQAAKGLNTINSLEAVSGERGTNATQGGENLTASAVKPSDFSIGKSIMITNHGVMNDVVSDVDFGYILGRVYAHFKNDVNPRNVPQAATPGEFVARMFDLAYREQKNHAALPSSQRLGQVPKADRYMDHVFKKWMSQEQMSKVKTADGLRGGPFRLLAIANLMENAGTIDNRGTSEASADPRALGELHLVYGLIDKDYEKDGKVYPQTWVLAFRFPAIKNTKDGWKTDKSLSQDNLMRNSSAWKEQMKNWASFWGSLSPLAMGTPEYKKQLRKILDIVVSDPANHINIRSNTKITDNEFELREWYMLMRSKQFIPRKPRQEPYTCLSGSKELGKVADWYWRPKLGDLDFSTYEVSALEIPPSDADINGYTLPRDDENDIFRSQKLKNWTTCPKERKDMPFEMAGEGAAGTEKRLIMSAPFARIKNDGIVWKLSGNTTENQRHAFAIRTCSGCHSQEGAAKGFHIFPRLANKDSELSAFLTGIGKNKFAHGNATYAYDQLRARLKLHVKAMNGEAALFEGLQRNDRVP